VAWGRMETKLHPRLAALPRRMLLGTEVPVALGCRARLLGLAGIPPERAGAGLLIPRCTAVHTFGMRFRLNLHFLDEDGRLLLVRRAVPPRRFAACRDAAAVLELPAGQD